MELLIGLLGALLGTAAGGLSVFLTSRAQMRRELEYAYDRELRARRIEAYMSLYKRTDKLPRYWRANPKRMELSDFSHAFDGWYFGEAGGLFLSDEARKAYHSMLEAMATVANEGAEEDQLSDEETQRLWRAGQALRRRLAADIGAAEDPRLTGRLPAVSPPATVRIRNGRNNQSASSQ
jgi:hypothetical protein